MKITKAFVTGPPVISDVTVPVIAVVVSVSVDTEVEPPEDTWIMAGALVASLDPEGGSAMTPYMPA
jgi:hypothetical protein